MMFTFFFFFQAEDGIRDYKVTGLQTCALPIYLLTTRYSDPLSVSAPQRPPQRLCRSPKPLQSPAVRGFPQLFKGPLPYLPDALARDPHKRPDLLERHRLAAFFETVVEVEDLALARREI